MNYGDCDITSCSKGDVSSVLPKEVWKEAGDFSGAFLLYKGEEVVSWLFTYERRLTVPGVELDVVGIGIVTTVRRYRGKGYTSHLLEHVLLQFSSGRYVAAVLFSRDRTLYSRAGFVRIAVSQIKEGQFLMCKPLMENVNIGPGPWLIDPAGHF